MKLTLENLYNSINRKEFKLNKLSIDSRIHKIMLQNNVIHFYNKLSSDDLICDIQRCVRLARISLCINNEDKVAEAFLEPNYVRM